INALRLFLKINGEGQIGEIDLLRPRREHRLPSVLSKEEVKRALESPTNLKHRAMLVLVYSCGLRRGELLALKPTDVDSNRGVVFIRQSKGKRDRLVPLSPRVLEMLRDYYRQYRPQHWLFEGQLAGHPYDERSLQLVLKSAVRKAAIHKPVTLHWLRHSYATHLLESGTDIRYIQELLGHKSSKTTEIYTHVSTHKIQQIKSPFDSL
ncbi:MAG: tyrosine-type recombinase/integrase, partial [Methylophilaceae bacterium]